MKRIFGLVGAAVIVGMLASCASKRTPERDAGSIPAPSIELELPELVDVPDLLPTGPALQQASSRWVPVRWADLPGFDEDPTHEAWNAWLQSCERPTVNFRALCSEVRRMALATPEQQRQWMRMRLQPYRIEALAGRSDGLLTSYFEPVYEARRQRGEGFEVPLYRPPLGLQKGRAWHTRRDIDTRADVQAGLAGREIVWLADPVDAMILHIQGSGRVRVTEPDGSQRMLRLGFAATNNQPYRSPGSWLLSQRLVQDATWPGIKTWLDANPHRVNEFLWSNPRVVFFNEQVLPDEDAEVGPRGAQGVPLTPGRSIAVDPKSIPYGTPVWLASSGPVADLQRLVLAQDTGSAIVGAVRADFFAGWGAEAGEFAGRLKQPLQLWALWPR